jgi:hypothetical protein
MVIFAAPQVVPMAEGEDMYFPALLVVKAMLLIMVILVNIIQNLGAKLMALLLIRNALRVIQTSLAAYVVTMEVALVHICLGEAPHATRLFIRE